MRAARVLDMLLVLQRRGRMTAGELADDARGLGADDPPRRRGAQRGRRPDLHDARRGWRDRADWTGSRRTSPASPPTRRCCLFLVGQPQVAHRLGLGAPTLTAREQARSSSLAPSLAEAADRLSSWFLHDPDPWTGNRVPHGGAAAASRAASIAHRQIELTMATRPRGARAAARSGVEGGRVAPRA